MLPDTESLLKDGEQPSERNQRIVDAAYALIEESGLDGMTIRAVLHRTGLSRRAFYERFEGKDDLMLAVFELTIKRAAAHYARQVAALPDPIQRLKLIVVSIGLGTSDLENAADMAPSRRGAAMSREHLRLAESRPDALQAALSPLIALIAGGLSDGMAAGVVRQGDPAQLATLVYNLVSTTVHTEFMAQETVRPDRERRVRLVDDVWEFCRRAIAA